MKRTAPVLYLIVPCYNEEEVLPTSSERLKVKIQTLIANKQIAEGSRILFVDDGSQDKTYQIITDLHHSSPLFTGVKLARNYGQQNAYMAGLNIARQNNADATITIDADLQDDLNAIDKMIDEYMQGARELLAAPISEDVEGCKNIDGGTYRYRKSTNDFAIGAIKDGIAFIVTRFMPLEGFVYCERVMNSELPRKI